MKFLRMAATLAAALLVSNSALSATEVLHSTLPSTTLAYGQSASIAADEPLAVTFAGSASTALTAFDWWGYHTPDSNGADAFAMALNGVLVAGPFIVESTGQLLSDPAGGPGNVMLMHYSINLAGLAAQSGTNEITLLNSDLGSAWWWQGAGGSSNPFEPAWQLTGVAQAVPEPQVTLMLFSGLLLIGALSGTRRQSATSGATQV